MTKIFEDYCYEKEQLLFQPNLIKMNNFNNDQKSVNK